MARRRAGPPIEIHGLTYRETGTDYDVAPHAHSSYQWYCVIFGRIDTVVDGQTFRLGPLDSVLIPPGAVRAPRCTGAAPAYTFVNFSNHRLRLGRLERRKVRVPKALAPDLHAFVTEISGSPGANTDDLVDALVVRLLIGLRRAAAAASRGGAQGAPLNVNYYEEVSARAEAFMRRNMHRKLSRAEIAAAVHLSEPHLARVFRTTRGITLVDRLTQLRVAQAKRLLLESSMSITRIALDVGYNSFSHFSKVFKSSVGIKPSDYRRAEGAESRLLRRKRRV
jgi:AraC-like DNA-binding protein